MANNFLSIEHTDDIKIFLTSYTNMDWKDHTYTLAVSNFIARIINYIPELMVNADFTIKLEDVLDTLRELIVPDPYTEYNSYIVRSIMGDVIEHYNEGYGYDDTFLKLEDYQYLINTYDNLVNKSDMYPILFQPRYLEAVMKCKIIKAVTEIMLNTISTYSKFYPILYDITSNPKYFFLVERVDSAGCLISYHVDPSA